MKTSLTLSYPQLASQWHPTLNGDLRADRMTPGSEKIVWWLGECGHEWGMSISSRTKKGAGCPYCSGKRVLAGFNDLATTHPSIAAEWHPTLNGNLIPEMVSRGNSTLVWWLGACGHEWDMIVKKRTLFAQNCPYCAGKRILLGYNDLSSQFPQVAAQWDAVKNNDLTPSMVISKSSKKAWFVCPQGHNKYVKISEATHSPGCRICQNQETLAGFNDLLTTHPDIAAQWHPSKNGSLTPEEITQGSSKKVWWQCTLGHEWDAQVREKVSSGSAGCAVCSRKKLLTGYSDLATTHPEIAAQWHPTLNGALTPEKVTYTNPQKVWWLGECGHEWNASIAYKAREGINSCAICHGRQLLTGYNDLATTHPKIAAEWHPTLNNKLTPTQVTFGSNKTVWWLGKCGHEWDMTVISRTCKRAQGCPVCSGQRILIDHNDLSTTHPQLANEWHPTLNGDLTPQQITAGNHSKAWWLGECGHEWKAIVKNRARDASCPYCSGKRVLTGYNDLGTTHPELAVQWHPTNNGELTPQQVTFGSAKRVWWLGNCGHEWDAAVVSRARKDLPGCPICSGHRILVGFNDLTTVHSLLVNEWHPVLNGDLTPEMVTAGNSSKRVWWQCPKGHKWSAKVADRTRSGGKATECPQCWAKTFISRGEQEIADYLTNELGLDITQSNRSLLKSTELDIYIPSKKLAIEYNGVYWHSSAMQSDHQYHQKKYELARVAGIQLLQVWEDEWRDKPELVKRLLAHKLGESREPLVGARQTCVEAISLAEARTFLNEYHVQGHSNGSYYLGLRSKKTNQLVAVMILIKRANQTGLTLEITRYATSCRVPGGFTKLLKYVEATLQPSWLVTFADHCISDGGLYASNGFTAEKELAPDYRYLVNKQRVHKFGYRLARFRADPSLLWEPGLTETQLAQLNGLHRVYDAGKTRWVKSCSVKLI